MQLDIDQLKRDVAGKWSGILNSLGVDLGDGKEGPCLFCGGKTRARWICDDKGEGYFCSHCDPNFIDGWAMVMKLRGVDFKSACELVGPIVGTIEVSQKKSIPTKNYMMELYSKSRPMQKADIGWQYLVNRGIDTMQVPRLGFCPCCYNSETKKEHPAIVATFISPSGEPMNIYRIYLTGDGKKLPVDNPKMWLPRTGPKLQQGAIRLHEFKSGSLGIAEGIETALAVAKVRNIPVWATTGTALMETFEPPEGVEMLEIYSDNDANYAGQKAAYTLAKRLCSTRDMKVDVIVPRVVGTDFLDELKDEI